MTVPSPKECAISLVTTAARKAITQRTVLSPENRETFLPWSAITVVRRAMLRATAPSLKRSADLAALSLATIVAKLVTEPGNAPSLVKRDLPKTKKADFAV